MVKFGVFLLWFGQIFAGIVNEHNRTPWPIAAKTEHELLFQ